MTMELQSIAGQSAMKYTLRVNTEAEDAAKTTKEQEASNASSASGSSESSKTANTAATQASGGAGGISDGATSTCANCGATLASNATVCGKCGTQVETASDQLLKALSESDLKANTTDNGISTLSVLGRLAQQEDEEQQ